MAFPTNVTLLLESEICKTRVGPSVVILTDKNPEPGRNLFLHIACSIGTPFAVRSCVTGNDGPNTTSFPKGTLQIFLSY